MKRARSFEQAREYVGEPGGRGTSIAVADCMRHDLWMNERPRERLLEAFGCVTVADLLDGYPGAGIG